MVFSLVIHTFIIQTLSESLECGLEIAYKMLIILPSVVAQDKMSN